MQQGEEQKAEEERGRAAYAGNRPPPDTVGQCAERRDQDQ
jgi:hypothetical protein